MKKNVRRFTQDEDNYIVKNHLLLTLKEMSTVLRRTESSVHSRKYRLGIKLPEDIRLQRWSCTYQHLIQSGKNYQFKKGNIPPNKGKKMSAELYAKAAPTMFKKGLIPHNHKTVGSERISKDGYKEIKVQEPNKWMLAHRKLWLDVNGSIPQGALIKFKDGNKSNITIENLYLTDRAGNAFDNSINRYPKELIKSIKTLAKLNKSIKNQSHE